MTLPMNISDLVNGRIIESSRIECKKDWNPQRILHTICAFANDIDNSGGGFVIVGMEEVDGIPRFTGIDPSTADSKQKELLGLCNLINPRLIPAVDICEEEGATLMVIRIYGGSSRPYSCPVHLGDRKSGERAYYIRKLSSTIQANRDDERRLFEISRRVPFDDMPCFDASVSDLRASLMRDFLVRAGSRDCSTDEADRSSAEMAQSLHVVSSTLEGLRPLNVGLMFFNDDPERFFRYARIEIVDKPDPTGQGMTERTFTGPIDRQLVDALQYIRNYIIRERIYKQDDRAEAVRFFNYPYAALEETLVNAVYHRGYDVPEPVTVVFESDRVTVTSTPGPDESISDADLRDGRLVSRTYRNRRIGDFLKDLRLAEGRNTGIPKVRRSLEANGSGMPTYITDERRSFLTVEIPVHPDFIHYVPAVEEGSLESRIVSAIKTEGCLSMKMLCETLGYAGVTNSVRIEVLRMIDEGKLVYLYPDKPRSPKQRICLPKGSRST